MKKLLIGLVGVAALLVAASLGVPSLIDWTARKDWVEGQLGALLGRDIAIAGPVSFRMVPAPRLTAEGVRLAAGDGPVELLSAESLDLHVRLLPLIGGRIEVTRLALVEPVVAIAPRPAGAGDAALAPGESAGGGAADVRLDAVTLTDGILLLHDGRGGILQAHDVDAQVRADSLHGPFEAAGTLVVGERALSLDLRSGRVSPAGALPLTLRVAIGGGTARFAGLVEPDGTVQGDLTAEAADPSLALGPSVPDAWAPLLAMPPWTLTAAVEGGPDGVALNGVDLTLGEAHATGAASIALADTPRVDVALSVNRLDLDAWAAAAPAPDDAGPAEESRPAGALPRALAVTVDLTVNALQVRDALVRQLRVEAALSNGAVTVSRLTAQLPGGSDLAMIGTLGMDEGRPVVDVSAEAASSDLRGVLAWIGVEVPDVPGARLRRFAGAARLAGTPDSFQVTGIDVSVDNTRLTGGLAVVVRDVPGIGLRLAADRLNLDAYRPDAVEAWGPAAADWLAAHWPDLLHAANANVDLTVGALTVDGVRAGDLALDATLNGGSLSVRRAAVGDLAGASAELSGRADALDPPAGLDLSFRGEADAPAQVLRALGLEPPLPPGALAPLAVNGQLTGDADAVEVTVNLDVAGGTLDVAGTVADPLGADPRVDLTARAVHPDLTALVRRAGPDYRPAGPLDGLDLYARLSGTAEAVTVDDLQGQLGTVILAGSLALDRRGDRPRIDADLRTGAVVLDDWLPAAAAAPAGRAAAPWPEEPFDLSALQAVDGTFSAVATSLRYGDLELAAPTLRAELARGRLTVDPFAAGLFGGRLGGRLTLAAEPEPALSGRVDLVGAGLAAALAAGFGVGGLDGTLDFGLEGRTAGADPAAWAAALTGEGLVAVRDGTMRGFDLSALGARLAEAPRDGSAAPGVADAATEGETAFAALNAPFTVFDGAAETDALRAVGDAGVVEGTARFDLARWRLDLTATARPLRPPGAPGVTLVLEGPPEALARRLETEALQAWLNGTDGAAPDGAPPATD